MAVTLAASKFAEWLERQMQRRGFGENRSKLAKYVGIRPSAVSAWFTRGAVPSPATCAKLAEVLKLPLDDVLRAAGHESIAGAPEGEQDDYPDWATLIPALTPGDAEYVGRLVESLVPPPFAPAMRNCTRRSRPSSRGMCTCGASIPRAGSASSA